MGNRTFRSPHPPTVLADPLSSLPTPTSTSFRLHLHLRFHLTRAAKEDEAFTLPSYDEATAGQGGPPGVVAHPVEFHVYRQGGHWLSKDDVITGASLPVMLVEAFAQPDFAGPEKSNIVIFHFSSSYRSFTSSSSAHPPFSSPQ